METKFQLHGKAMKMLRLSRDLQGKDVADSIGVTKGHISLCENDKRKLSVDKTKKFLELVGMTQEEAKAFVHIVGNNQNGGESN